MKMKRFLFVLLCSLLLCGTAGCGSEDPSGQTMNDATQGPGILDDAADDIKDGVEDITDDIEDAADRAGKEADEAKDSMTDENGSQKENGD